MPDGQGDANLDPLEETYENERKTSSASSCAVGKPLYLYDIDNVVLHCLVSLMMEYIADSKAVNEETVPVELIKELLSVFKLLMVTLTNSADAEELSIRPNDLR